jgi:hypothetical protein
MWTWLAEGTHASLGIPGTATSAGGPSLTISRSRDLALRERQHEGGVRKGGRPQEGLDVEAFADVRCLGEIVGQPERQLVSGAEEDRERVALACPEVVVVDDRVELLEHPRPVAVPERLAERSSASTPPASNCSATSRRMFDSIVRAVCASSVERPVGR